jgi:hypothetical protein
MKRMTTYAGVVGAAVMALIAVGCGSSSRTAVSGYTDQMLNGKRIFVLLPKGEELLMNNSEAYASSRGVAQAGAREMLYGELRSELLTAFDHRFDSNTILSYHDQPVGAMVALSSTDDFNNGVPKSWDRITEAGRNGNIDYLLVLNHFSMSNTKSASGLGPETAETDFALLDVMEKKVMTTGSASVSLDDPRQPSQTYKQLAEAISRKLPFNVPEVK